MNTFGKKGIGNESTYNSGFALATYIANEYGSDALSKVMEELSSPLQFSINKAILNVTGTSGRDIYQDFKTAIEAKYNTLVDPIRVMPVQGEKLQAEGTTNIHPKWHPTENAYLYLSNKGNDYFSQTNLYYHDLNTGEDKKIKSGVFSAPTWHSNGEIIYYSRKPKSPNKNGSKFYDIYSFNIKEEEEERLTSDLRAFSPVFIENDSTIAYLATYDGGQDIYLLDLKSNSSTKITNFKNRPMISHLSYNKISNKIYFDITEHHFRDIYSYDIDSKKIESVSSLSLIHI